LLGIVWNIRVFKRAKDRLGMQGFSYKIFTESFS